MTTIQRFRKDHLTTACGLAQGVPWKLEEENRAHTVGWHEATVNYTPIEHPSRLLGGFYGDTQEHGKYWLTHVSTLGFGHLIVVILQRAGNITMHYFHWLLWCYCYSSNAWWTFKYNFWIILWIEADL